MATVRYETAPGKQLQVDFGQKKVQVGGALVTVHLLVATPCYSQRVFVLAADGDTAELALGSVVLEAETAIVIEPDQGATLTVGVAQRGAEQVALIADTLPCC